MKQPKKLESLKQSTFQDLNKLAGGGSSIPSPTTSSRGLGFMKTGVLQSLDIYNLPESPLDKIF
jgi:hypothetical protein